VGSLPAVRRLRRSRFAVSLGWLAVAHGEVSRAMQITSGRGVLIRASQAALLDIEASGAADAAIVADGTSFAGMAASDVHDNPGAG
jgi:hypothetical protein